MAATITVDGSGLRTLRAELPGKLAPAGGEVLVGYFAGLTDSQIIDNRDNPSFLEAKFVSFGLGGLVGQGTDGAGGSFLFDTSTAVESPAPTFTAPSSPNNNQIYVWIFDSATSPTLASWQAIFTSSSSNWSWPGTDDGFTDRSISLDDPLVMLAGSIDAGAVYSQPVPEPGCSALMALGTCVIFSNRCRCRDVQSISWLCL